MIAEKREAATAPPLAGESRRVDRQRSRREVSSHIAGGAADWFGRRTRGYTAAALSSLES